MTVAELELERLDLVPTDVREYVIARDNSCCRVCGRWVETPALHHIVFRSHGGPDLPSNLITVGWLPGHDCHLTIAHGRNARMWREIFLAIAEDHPGTTAFQYRRWNS